jgi:opacity protein-like surface antigen
LDFDYRADVQFFADHSSQNDVAHRVSLTFASPLAPSLDVRVRDLFVVTEDQFARDERLSNPTGLRPVSDQRRARTIRNEADGRIDVRPGGRLSLGLLVGSLIEDVDVPEELDEFRYSVGTELGYTINVARDSRVFVGYQVTFESFRTNGSLPPGTSDASFRVHAIGTGVRHELTPTLAGNVGIGYSFTSSDAPQNDGHNAVIASAGLIKTYNLGRASFNYDRRFSSGEGEGGVVITDTLSGSVTVNLTGKLTARLDSNLSWFNFQDVTAGTGAEDQRFWSVRPSLTYQILRPWSVSVGYIYGYTDYTEGTSDNRSDHQVLLGTQFALREWLTLGLSYRYASRQVHGNSPTAGVDEFSRNQVMLTVTANPTLRF